MVWTLDVESATGRSFDYIIDAEVGVVDRGGLAVVRRRQTTTASVSCRNKKMYCRSRALSVGSALQYLHAKCEEHTCVHNDSLLVASMIFTAWEVIKVTISKLPLVISLPRYRS